MKKQARVMPEKQQCKANRHTTADLVTDAVTVAFARSVVNTCPFFQEVVADLPAHMRAHWATLGYAKRSCTMLLTSTHTDEDVVQHNVTCKCGIVCDRGDGVSQGLQAPVSTRP